MIWYQYGQYGSDTDTIIVPIVLYGQWHRIDNVLISHCVSRNLAHKIIK